jgi:hypothetical protein
VKVEKTKSCWLWIAGKSAAGYGMTYNAQRRLVLAHRASWEMEHGEIPEDRFVCHKCDIRNCVRPDHLFLGSSADNHQDMVNKGRHAKGAQLPQSKLSEAEVRQIRASYALRKTTHGQLAVTYGVSRSAISAILSRQRWKHI